MTTPTYHQKMKVLQQKRANYDEEIKRKKREFKREEEHIKTEILNDLTSILNAQNPFELDLETFLGGVLFVVSEMKLESSKLTTMWQQKGASEVHRFQNPRRQAIKAAVASEMDQEAA